MRKLYLGSSTKLYLETSEDVDAAKVTLVAPDGAIAKDSEDNPIQDKDCASDESGLYYDFDLATDTEAGYYRIFWQGFKNSARVELEESNNPEDVRVEGASYEREILPVTLFTGMFLPNVPLKDFDIQVLREEIILPSQVELERETEVYFAPHQVIDEKHDYYLEEFRKTFWLTQLYEFPIISVEAMTLKYNKRVIAEIDPDWLVISERMGTVELVPQAAGSTGYLYSMIVTGLSGLSVDLFTGFYRIPVFFHIDYTAGVDFDNLPNREQSDIRHAIGRRTAINLLQKIDDRMGISAESTSIDGVSQSISYTASAMYGQYSAQLEQYKKDDEMWIQRFRRKYMKDSPAVVA